MTVKNYLVSAVRPIRDGWHLEKNQDLYKNYEEMYRCSLASFRKFCREPFESILWNEPVDDCDTYTEENWKAIKDLWHKEPCNIFWAGADTIMIRPTSVFSNQFNEYRLFNYTDPRSHREFEHYFNDDIQYFPATMKSETWEFGEQYWLQREGHPDRHWGFDQNRHNAMFWSQDIPLNDRCHPEMAWQAFGLRSADAEIIQWHEQWNSGCQWSQAHILHLAGSRGSEAVVQVMQKICGDLKITL